MIDGVRVRSLTIRGSGINPERVALGTPQIGGVFESVKRFMKPVDGLFHARIAPAAVPHISPEKEKPAGSLLIRRAIYRFLSKPTGWEPLPM